MSSPLLEICIDSFASAVAAIRGGADRLELCAALSEGGLTPSVGLLREIRRFTLENVVQHREVKLYAMVRCRRGSDFCYSEPEMRIMLHDLELLAQNGADGFVFGALDETGNVHREHCGLVVAEASKHKKPVTFHRAFDCTDRSKMLENSELVASLGFTTLLSSGLEGTAMEGIQNLTEMVKFVSESERMQLTVMPGSGVSPRNVQEIVQKTGCRAVHASARSLRKGPKGGSISMGGNAADGEGLLVCDETIVREIKNLLTS
ncbi:copper homeostasis protein cutC homolog [Aedes albopictus]|uniref:Copper homeostasis protein cutC homolog n=1 Tax=Aedes albopictus TaxID=7160 RepID=A0ABM1YUW6_AEDAL